MAQAKSKPKAKTSSTRRGRAAPKAAPKARAKARKKAGASAKPDRRRTAKKAAPRRRRSKKQGLGRELGALAEKITSIGKAVLEHGTERAGEIARTGISAIGQGREKIGDEIAAIKRAALARVRH